MSSLKDNFCKWGKVINLHDLVVTSNKTIQFKICFGPRSYNWALRLFSSRVAKRGLGPKHIVLPKNINSITINVTLEGIEKKKNWEIDNKVVWFISASKIDFSPPNSPF